MLCTGVILCLVNDAMDEEAVFLHIVENLVEKVEKQQSVKWKNWCRNEFKPNESHQKPRKYGIFLKKVFNMRFVETVEKQYK